MKQNKTNSLENNQYTRLIVLPGRVIAKGSWFTDSQRVKQPGCRSQDKPANKIA